MNNQRLLIAVLILAYVFSPSLLNWMINPEGSWLRPYIIWSGLIVAAFIVQLSERPSEDLNKNNKTSELKQADNSKS